MKRILLCIAVILASCPSPGKTSETSSSIPDVLQACYRRNFTIISRPPLTMKVLIEMLRKVELNEKYNTNTRVLTTSMIHGVIFDGIEKSPDMTETDFAIPYAATLNKFHKFKVILDYLISGKTALFPMETLTLAELCFLHQLTSNTVYRFTRGDEDSTCEDTSLMPRKSAHYSTSSTLSNCPLKQGNIHTKWGPISVSHLIGGIAAGLQPEEVTFQRVFDAIHVQEGKNLSLSYEVPLDSNNGSQNIDSILFVAITGDLGEVVLSQVTETPAIGNQGYWNDTLLPRAFYLKSQQWDLTEAEVLGGIDGAAVGKKAAYLLNILDSTRLSQLLDMYYSDRGIPYEFNFKVTERTKTLNYLLENINFSNQIYGSTKLLQAHRSTYSVTMTDAYIQQLSLTHADIYKTTAGSITNNYDKIEYVTGKRLLANLELIVILDGTFNPYTTQQMLYALSEAIDVSYYGSRMGIINGQTGEWITNVTRENFEMFRTFQLMDQQGNWPATLSLGRSLESVNTYYQNQTEIDCRVKVMNSFGRAVLVFSQDGRLTETDATRARRSLDTIKQAYPETSMIYLSQDVDGVLRELSKNDDDSVVNPSTDALSTITKIVEKLSVIAGSLIKFYCNNSNVRFEHYFTPGEEKVFEIHREYIKRSAVTTKFKNKDYGDLSICVFTKRTSQNNRKCQPLTVNSEISFNSGSLCTPDSACDLQYSLTANNTQIKCAETDCRYPDQVLVIITYTFSSGASDLKSSLLTLGALIWLLT
ncbi:uncharacterized protein [Euwallacea fornicatus]|uniref:uncharacterized protein n=1 Tax=Euwallacea fornicatus TaxID=995702 RepID=UPI00339044F0